MAKLAGKPEPLKEVHLISGDYFERLDHQLLREEKASPCASCPRKASSGKEFSDWQVKDGELLGRKLERAAGQTLPSALQYFSSHATG